MRPPTARGHPLLRVVSRPPGRDPPRVRSGGRPPSRHHRAGSVLDCGESTTCCSVGSEKATAARNPSERAAQSGPDPHRAGHHPPEASARLRLRGRCCNIPRQYRGRRRHAAARIRPRRARLPRHAAGGTSRDTAAGDLTDLLPDPRGHPRPGVPRTSPKAPSVSGPPAIPARSLREN